MMIRFGSASENGSQLLLIYVWKDCHHVHVLLLAVSRPAKVKFLSLSLTLGHCVPGRMTERLNWSQQLCRWHEVDDILLNGENLWHR